MINVTILLLIVLAGCSSLAVRHVPEGAAPHNDGGILYALPKPVWLSTVKGARGGVLVDPASRDYEIALKPAFVPDPREVYEVKLSPGVFTSDSLKVTIGEDGTLRNVVSTSEPQLTETLKVVASLVSSAATFGILSKAVPEPPAKTRDKEEVARLTALEKDLRTALEKEAGELAKKPTREGAETLKLLKEQLAHVTASRQQLEEKINADTYTTGAMTTEVIQVEPVLCSEKQAFPEPSEIEQVFKNLPDEEKDDPRNRFFVFIRPAGSNGTQQGCFVKR